jgi:hypothetical protein
MPRPSELAPITYLSRSRRLAPSRKACAAHVGWRRPLRLSLTTWAGADLLWRLSRLQALMTRAFADYVGLRRSGLSAPILSFAPISSSCAGNVGLFRSHKLSPTPTACAGHISFRLPQRLVPLTSAWDDHVGLHVHVGWRRPRRLSPITSVGSGVVCWCRFRLMVPIAWAGANHICLRRSRRMSPITSDVAGHVGWRLVT